MHEHAQEAILSVPVASFKSPLPSSYHPLASSPQRKAFQPGIQDRNGWEHLSSRNRPPNHLILFLRQESSLRSGCCSEMFRSEGDWAEVITWLDISSEFLYWSFPKAQQSKVDTLFVCIQQHIFPPPQKQAPSPAASPKLPDKTELADTELRTNHILCRRLYMQGPLVYHMLAANQRTRETGNLGRDRIFGKMREKAFFPGRWLLLRLITLGKGPGRAKALTPQLKISTMNSSQENPTDYAASKGETSKERLNFNCEF